MAISIANNAEMQKIASSLEIRGVRRGNDVDDGVIIRDHARERGNLYDCRGLLQKESLKFG